MNSREWGCSLWYHKHSGSSCNSCRLISDTDLIFRPDFLLETITQLIAHWWKIKKILNKTFSNPLFKIMSSCIRIKILFTEYKYFRLNTNIFYWILNIKYFSLSLNIFLLNPNIFHWIQKYLPKYQIFCIEYKYFLFNIDIISLNTKIHFCYNKQP